MARTGAAFAALLASGCAARALGSEAGHSPYGALRSDPAGLLDLPAGFAYVVLSSLGDRMDDGGRVPNRADGMGAFALPNGRIALVRNHELRPGEDGGNARGPAFDRLRGRVLPGGTTTLLLDPSSLKVESQFRSLAGTIRNCAGGTTPWGTWLTCEEDVTRAGQGGVGRDHGWVFEVPAGALGPADPVPLTAMGRFNHEATAVDPATGIVYLTEDREDGLLYRFMPARPGRLAEGGRLQALALPDPERTDSRNWRGQDFPPGSWELVRWVDLENVESPDDDLRDRGQRKGALRFARGEGIYMGAGELYFTCTSGGSAKLGQIFRLALNRGERDRLRLFFESTDPSQLSYGDNLTITPDGELIVCEDQGGLVVENHLRGITRDGLSYPLARCRVQTELAGACFSPDGRVLFVNLYKPTRTLAITGPWRHLRRA